jgi:hypothetical protein
MPKPPEPGHVVKEYMIGGTKIQICDDAYINRTREDIERTLERIVAIGWRIVESARAAGRDI